MSSLALDPLSSDEADRLVRLLLTVDDLPSSVHGRILERAEGNPFFLEEIVRRLIDGGLLRREGDRWRATLGIEDVDIPDTVQAVLASRIDLLDAGDKRLLQAASVVGRVFWTGPITELTDVSGADASDAFAAKSRSGPMSTTWATSLGCRRALRDGLVSCSTRRRHAARCPARSLPGRRPLLHPRRFRDAGVGWQSWKSVTAGWY